MNKNLLRKLTVVLLIFGLVVSSVPFSYATDKTKTDEKKAAIDPLEVLKTYATERGMEYGKMFSGRDFIQGLKDNSRRHFSDSRSVFDYFKMNSDSSQHKKVFYDAFILSYRASYEANYISLSSQGRDNNETFWYTAATKYGEIEGTIAAYYDHMNEFPFNWEKAFKNTVAKESLQERFRLFRFGGRLPKNFEDDFKLAFKTQYEKAYGQAILDDNELNTNYYYVDADGGDVPYERMYKQVEKSQIVPHLMPKVELVVPARAILERTPISVRYKQFRNKKIEKYLVPISDIYEVELQRDVKQTTFYVSPTIKINGYAVRGAGIYKWSNNRWNYIYTDLDEKTLSAKIDTGVYKNTQYAVFIDNSYIVPSDINFNWAYKEIYTALRRHYFTKTDKFNPEGKLTRRALADMIYNSMAYRGAYTNGNLPSDVAANSSMVDAIKFCIGKNYMTVDANNKFNPEALVKYSDFETLMKRINPSFRLTDLTQDQLNKKYYRSDYITGKNPHISRSEAIYAIIKYLD